MVSSIGGTDGFDATSLAKMREKMFNSLDKSGDGSIDKDEIGQLLAKASNIDSSVDDIFNAVDSDKSGTISSDEFKSALDKMAPPNGSRPMPPKDNASSAQMKQEMFDAADLDGNGKIDIDELMQMRANGPEHGPSADEMFSAMDTDQDGGISKSESDAFIDKMPPPPRMDRPRENDSDGVKMSGASDNTSSAAIKALLDLANKSYRQANSINSAQDYNTAYSFALSWSA